MTTPHDRIRRILADGAPPTEKSENGPPRLRQVAPEGEGGGAVNRVERQLSPELRSRLDALGVGLAGSMPLRRRDDEEDGPSATDRRPPAEPYAPDGMPTPVPIAEAEADTTLDALVGGVDRETAHGTFLYVERHYPLTAAHGKIPLEDGLRHPIPLRPHEQSPGAAPLEAPPLFARDAVFLDTETTGLSGGTGTVAFLVGTGRVEGERFVVRQYCMRDYPEEAALLSALHDDLGDAPLVSFNGRGFDWPLLTTRFRLHRAHPLPRTHFDLLPPARRIWARTLHSHSLGALERYVLELDRGSDLPGWRIPSAYFEYLKTGYADTISLAFRHNEIDVVSMLALFAVVAETLDDPIRRVARPGDQLGTARLLLDLGQVDRARACLEAGLACAEGVEGVPLQRLLGRLCRRAGDDDGAIQHWQAVIDEGPDLDVEAYEQIAKIHEHSRGDFRAALESTQKALTRVTPGSAAEAALEHRARRLERRLAKTRPDPGTASV